MNYSNINRGLVLILIPWNALQSAIFDGSTAFLDYKPSYVCNSTRQTTNFMNSTISTCPCDDPIYSTDFRTSSSVTEFNLIRACISLRKYEKKDKKTIQ